MCRVGVTMSGRMRPWRGLLLLLASLLVVGVAASVPAAADDDSYDFQTVSCDAPQFVGRLPAGMDVECGLLSVPENRDLPIVEGNTVVLPVAILQSRGLSRRRTRS